MKHEHQNVATQIVLDCYEPGIPSSSGTASDPEACLRPMTLVLPVCATCTSVR